MLSLTSLIPLLLLPGVLAGNAIIKNTCGGPIYATSVGSTAGSQNIIQPGGTYSEPYRLDPRSGGIAIKVTTVNNGIYTGAPEFDFQYTLDGPRVWYQANNVRGNPFNGVTIRSANVGCNSIVWPNGVPQGAENPQVCTSADDITVTLNC